MGGHGNRIACLGARRLQRFNAHGGAGIGAEGERRGVALFLQALQLCLVVGTVHAGVYIDVLAEFHQGIGAETGGNRPGLKQAHKNAATVDFTAQGVAQAFEGKFAAVVGAAPRHGGKAQNAAVHQYAPVPLAAE